MGLILILIFCLAVVLLAYEMDSDSLQDQYEREQYNLRKSLSFSRIFLTVIQLTMVTFLRNLPPSSGIWKVQRSPDTLVLQFQQVQVPDFYLFQLWWKWQPFLHLRKLQGILR